MTTFDDLLARELARHYTGGGEAQTVDEALGNLADACWSRAEETLDPYEDENAARALILSALECATRQDSDKHRDYRAALVVFKAGRFTMQGASKNAEHQRLLRTYRLMADRLWETWVCDLTQRCDDQCQHPENCPSAAVSSCARTEAFPYLKESFDGEGKLVRVPNWNRTAHDIVTGLKSLKASGKLTHLPDTDAVRNALRRL